MPKPSEAIRPELLVASDLPAAGDLAARLVCELSIAAAATSGRFTMALSGGSTPAALFDAVAARYADRMPWTKIHVFWSDERSVPPTSPESNYRLADEHLLKRVPIPAANIHRIPAETGAAAAASAYSGELRRFFGVAPPAWPRFDLILLGVGDEGHTASLFPGTAALKESAALVVANYVPKVHSERITFTYPLINAAACVVVLACGAAKAPVVGRIFGHEALQPGEEPMPVASVSPRSGRYLWIVDTAATPDHGA
jgi:6-phosphogluconolactonase